MSRVLLALALSLVTASPVLAKDLCIQFNVGTFAGSHLTVKSVKLGKRTFGSVDGYIAEYAGGSGFGYFLPVHGSTLAGDDGNVVLALTINDVRMLPSGTYSIGNDPISAVNYVCIAGSDGKIGTLDTCAGYVGGVNAMGHVIPCSEAGSITD